MAKIYFSHTGNKIIGNKTSVNVKNGNLLSILSKLDEYQGIVSVIVDDDNRLKSNVRIFRNIETYSERNDENVSFFENNQTEEIKGNISNIVIGEEDKILISIFEPEKLIELIEEGLAKEKDDDYKELKIKPVLSKIVELCEDEKNYYLEPVYKFQNGEVTLKEISYKNNEEPKIIGSDGRFNKKESKIIPEELVVAIKKIWNIDDNIDASLRLFQEDSLFFIMSKLIKNSTVKEGALLLSMPTGGGKTEAFMIPILAHIFEKKKYKREKSIKALVIYPTNALANDQALRFSEILFKLNKETDNLFDSSDRKITIGILSGDTPNSNYNLVGNSLFNICPNCGNSSFKEIDGNLVCNSEYNGDICGTKLDFCVLTKEEIIKNPPDILITNPDTINYDLHSPKYAGIFYHNVEIVVFDEVHLYNGIFGCNVSHLLRRLEEAIGEKPLYVGLSATIGNAIELAALLFNEKIDNIFYLKNENNRYLTKNIERYRHHIVFKPALINKDKKNERYVRTMSSSGIIALFIAHLISDSHFRKTMIFTNYRTETDDLARYLNDREALDFKYYMDTIINKISRNIFSELTDEEIEICEYMYAWIKIIIDNTSLNKNKAAIGWNRGGLEKEDRIRSINLFSLNKILKCNIEEENKVENSNEMPKDIMVATKALEVGIDIGDVTTVINSSAPYTCNEYVQRIGRAGRKNDSLAVTVVNPENAIDAYFISHMEEYFKAKVFEDAPIIISNEIILKRHIWARILDFVTNKIRLFEEILENDIKVFQFKQYLRVNRLGRAFSLGDNLSLNDIKEFSEQLFEEIFVKKSIGKISAFENFKNFIEYEASVIKTVKTEINKELIVQLIEEKIIEFNKRIKKQQWKDNDVISGFSVLDKDINPNLRGSGKTVNLIMDNSEEKVVKDVVDRQFAYRNMPPSARFVVTTTSGDSTFMITGESNNKFGAESDEEGLKNIRKTIFTNNNSIQYFSRKFDSFKLEDYTQEEKDELYYSLNFKMPNSFNVDYYPSRFYCENCEKGLVPIFDTKIKKDGIYCRKCGKKVRQLHLVYVCSNENCGEVFDPPVQKACLNPECSDFKKMYSKYVDNSYHLKQEHLEHFKFRLTKDLKWECKTCKSIINFSKSYRIKEDNSKKRALIEVVEDRSKKYSQQKTPLELAVYLKAFPEIYGKDNNNRSSKYFCPKCRDGKNIETTIIPKVKSSFFTFYGSLGENIKDEQIFKIGKTTFQKGFAVELANSAVKKFTYGVWEKQIKFLPDLIYGSENTFLSNYYETHFAWIKFDNSIDEFLKNIKYSCNGNCDECSKMKSLEMGKIMKPETNIETYQWDNSKNKPKRPDKREVYCKKALNNDCQLVNCSECKEFDKIEFLRFIIIHTLKHAIIWGLPKYAGVNISEIRGEVYPNDRQEGYDLILIDSNEGGSGVILLVEKHWELIWNFVTEIIEKASEGKANLLLPHTCRRNNADICPIITQEYLKYIENR